MRAVRFHGRGDIRVDEVEEPICGNGQVKASLPLLLITLPPRLSLESLTRNLGLDRFDLPLSDYVAVVNIHEYLAGPMIVPVTPHPLTDEKLPTTLGHEFSGTVEEIGSGVTGFKVGDRVVVKPNLFDGTCSNCSLGIFNCCERVAFIGFSIVDSRHAIPLPESIPLDIGALVEPLAVAWHAVSRSPLQRNDTVLVVGAGPIGLAIIQVLKVKGITSIVAVEVSERRRGFALALGATEVLNPVDVDAVTQIRALTKNAGADVVFECSGAQAGLDTAVAGLREKNVIGAALYDDGDFEAVMDEIASGGIQPRPMITSKIRMEDVDVRGFKALIEERDKHVKILVDISA
ncbi:uncharacterized protein N7525_006747 [Penicillium rubens]|uniref:uncharacterized protein n=1 Tax=Penicillium rubens TaxID=1108849 RepID=UPI002A5AD514|nr:uncharacterized protein N7525_006747 [Penicillium rubens]KAJ5828494.1 hypothetical protein N7525_006747 [Penicillium rubens]